LNIFITSFKLYYTWLVIIDKNFPEEEGNAVNQIALELYLGSYIVVTTLLGFIYIGRLSEMFSRVYKKVNANASLMVARVLVTEEKYLGLAKLRSNKKYMRRFCGPMVRMLDRFRTFKNLICGSPKYVVLKGAF